MSEPSMAEIMLMLGAGTRQLITSWTRCGQPTRAGTPCKNFRMAAGAREWSACSRHATAEESAEHQDALARERDEAQRLLLARHQSLPVACWSWPVAGEHLRRAGEARDCLHLEQARSLAWDLLVDWQARRCAICGSRDDRYLDHSHETGLVRGWLCHGCNIGEGLSHIPGGQFERYREKNPATILGIKIRYRDPRPSWYEPTSPAVDRSPGYLLATYLADGD
jgi:hypothetical protein